MGRPLPPRIIGDVSVNGEQIRLFGIVDTSTGIEELYIKEQINAQRFDVVSVSDENRIGIVNLQQEDPVNVGEARIKVKPFGSSGSADLAAEMKAESVSINEEASGYTDGDTLTVSGGTFGTAVEITVDSTDTGGEILTVSLNNVGAGYTDLPTNPVSVSGGSGTGALFDLSWELDNIVINSGGSGYTEVPLVNISGNTGDNAEVTATISGGAVNSVTIDNAGDGFEEVPSIVVEGPADEHARTVLQYLVKTFEGNIYKYDVDDAADESGEADISAR